jgi:tetratricopeptide (TPR) repeat protein
MARLWGDSYIRKKADLEEMEADISREVSAKLRLKLSTEEQKRVTENATNDADARELYLKGLFNWKTPTEESLRKSIQFFTEAIEKDPKYARAYAGLANAYSSLGANYLRPADTYPKSRFYAQRALELDDSLAEAHYAIAVVRFFDEWNLKETDKELSRTLELNPSYAPAYSMRSTLNLAREQTNDAVSNIKQALKLDPLSLYFNINLASAYYYSHQYNRAQEQMTRVLEIDPRANYYQAEIGVNYAQMGLYDQALDASRKALLTDSDNPSVLCSVGVVYALSGKRKEAEQTIEDIKAIAKRKYVQAYLIALVYAALDKRDEAFAWLEKVTEERSGLLCRLRVDPTFDKIRSDPRYADLLKRTHLAD